jgi:hypothetical protein
MAHPYRCRGGYHQFRRPEEVKKFLENDGVIAWGIVPTSDKINEETPASLVEKLNEKVKNLAKKGMKEDLIWEKCLLTPSCGTGSLSVELSDKIFHHLSEVSHLLRH